jgi:hypothetical protein
MYKDGYWSGTCYGGSINVPVAENAKIGLTGFSYNLVGTRDFHLRGTGVLLRNEQRLNGLFPYPELSFYDNSKTDDFYYYASYQELPPGSTIHSISGVDSGYGFSKLLGTSDELPGEPVLLSFEYRFIFDDHHIKRIESKVWKEYCLNAVYAECVFQDKNHDDPFEYNLVYAMVPYEYIKPITHVYGQSSGGHAQKSINSLSPYLKGFNLNFNSGDHHLDRLGVRLNTDKVDVWYQDKNADDAYTWDVWYSDIKN